jgi:lipid A 3-O-deacylase
MRRFIWIISLCTGSFCLVARADIPIVEIGSGNGVKMTRVAFQIDSGRRWLFGDQWHVAGYWEPALGFWTGGPLPDGSNRMIYEFALTPNLRLEKKILTAWSAYVEYGLGVHLITGHHVTDSRDLGSNYHFGNHAGLGLRFGAKNEFDVGYRVQHLSNAGLRQPNRGIDFHLLHLRYSY